MGRALAPMADAPPGEKYGPAASNPFAVPDPFVGPGLHYGVQRRDKRVFHREWAADPDGKVLAQAEAEVQFVLGSGSRGRSYLINHDGYLFQSPVTWYPESGRWNLAPGYETRNQHFSRPVRPGCLFCHCNQTEPVEHTANRYRQPVFQGYAIGCERCHGPGELHVRRRMSGAVTVGMDDTIVNPRRLDHALREAVCQQCHLQGEVRVLARGRAYFDYRPGLPLHLFMIDFVQEGEGHKGSKFVGSVEQMVASRCYRASRGAKKLGCTSCHDPHRAPAPEEKVAFYRQRCLQCHTDKSCSLSPAVRRAQDRDDSCFACHMPRTGSEINHASITDHRILRRAEKPGKAPPRSFPVPSALVPFHRDLLGPRDEKASRNLGVALIAILERGPPKDVAGRFADKALPLLEAALRRDRNDVTAWESKGTALWWLGNQEDALAAYETALSQKPDWETTLHAAAKLAFEMGHLETGRSYLERAIRVNPWRWQYYHLLAGACFQSGEWERAVQACRQSLRLEPFNSTTRRRLLVESYLRLGREDKARTEYETLLELSPEDRRPDLRRWFEEQRR
jgi:predicted CXXCH cytochrome family protein